MQHFIKSFLAVILAGAILASCKSKSDIGKMIPADAVLAGYFDTKSLLDKLPYDDIKSTQLYQDMYADSTLPAWSKTMLDDPKKAGIDLSKGMIGYMSKGTGDDFNFVIKGFVSSAADFEAFNKNLAPDATVNSGDKKMKSMTLRDEGVVGWDDQHFMYVINIQDPSQQPEEWQPDPGNLPRLPKGNMEAAQKYLTAAFNLAEKNSLAGDDRFGDLMKEKGDMKVWMNTEKMFSLTPLGVLGMLKLDALIKDTRVTYAVDFGKGNIAVDQKAYYGKEMTDLLKKYQGENVNAAAFEKIPSDDILGAMAVNIKPELLRELLKMTGLDGMANMYLGQVGVSLEDVVNAINGKILVSFSDLKTRITPGSPANMSDIDYNNLFSVGVKNKGSMQKLIDAFLKASGGVVPAEAPYILTDKEFAVSNNKAFADAYVAGKDNKKPDWTGKISGHPFGLYIDIQKILQASPMPEDTSAAKSMAVSKSFWKDIYSYGGDFSGNALKLKTEVNLMQQDENSLKQLNRYLDEIYRTNKNRIRYTPSESDSLVAPEVPDTIL